MKICAITENRQGYGLGHSVRTKNLINGLRKRHRAKIVECPKKADITIIDLFGVKDSFVKKIRQQSDGFIVVIYTGNTYQKFPSANIVTCASARLDGYYMYNRNGKTTHYWLGKEYSLIDENFENIPEKQINKKMKNILITTGGEDSKGVIFKIVQALKGVKGKYFTIILGKAFSQEEKLRKIVPKKWVLKNFMPNLMDEMLNCDGSISAGGLTAYELCRSGVPAIIIPKDKMEDYNMKAFEKARTIKKLDMVDKVKIFQIKKTFNKLEDFNLRKKMSANAQKFITTTGIPELAKQINVMYKRRKKSHRKL